MELSAITSRTRTIQIPIQFGDKAESLSVTRRFVTLQEFATVMQEVNDYRRKVTEADAAGTARPDIKSSAIVMQLASIVTAWDLTENAAPLPLTRENLTRLDGEFLNYVLGKVLEDVSPNFELPAAQSANGS